MIYLASPYSHFDESVREERYKRACQCTAELLKRGLVVFSPIVHSHALVPYGLPTDFAGFWEHIDIAMIRLAESVFLLAIPGWEESKGVAKELQVARYLKIPVHCVDVFGKIIHEDYGMR